MFPDVVALFNMDLEAKYQKIRETEATQNMVSNHEKLTALKFAYQIITDKRNMNRYCDTFITSKASGEEFGYDNMLSVLCEMAKELQEGSTQNV